MFHTILFPTDFTELASRAGQMAAGLARQSEARIVVFHVVEPVVLPGTEDDEELQRFAKELEARAGEQIEPIVSQFRQQGINCEGTVVVGHVYECLAELVREKNADLVVMGSHSLTGEEKKLAGNLSQKAFFLLNDAPILFVR